MIHTRVQGSVCRVINCHLLYLMWSASLRGKQLEQDSTVNKVYKLIKIKKVDINLVILETQNDKIRILEHGMITIAPCWLNYYLGTSK